MRSNLGLFRSACAEYSGLFQYWGPFDRWDHGFAVTALISSSSVREVEFLEMMGHSLNKQMSDEEAEAETRHQFAVRANAILAFIECDEEQRPKLRKAIIEAMLWAQTQPKLTR
jgi:hypothetical protein